MKKLFLIDAYAIIYRSYYAFIKTPRINSKGLNTSAIYGFVNTLEDVLKRELPTHIAVAFDPSGPTFRHEAYEKYKAQREATPEDIRKAIPIIKDLVSAYRIPILQVDGFEADDVIGTMAKKAEKLGFKTYMLTPDKDYAQLVSDNIFMYRPKHNGGYETMGPEQVKIKYGLTSQEQVIDLLGLMGDSSDNIPGCPGVGEKTAAKLLQEFGSIDNLLSSTDKLKGALKLKIEDNKDQIIFSRFLATIRKDVPIELDEESLKIEKPDDAKLQAMFQDLEFRSRLTNASPVNVINKVSSPKSATGPVQTSLFDLLDEPKQAPADTQTEEAPVSTTENQIEENQSLQLYNINSITHKYTRIADAHSLKSFVEELSYQPAFCFDTETTDVDVFNAELVGLSFCWKAGEAYFIPVDANNEKDTLDVLRPIFEDCSVGKIGHNIKFDMLILARCGVNVCGDIFDTMIAHYILQPELRHGMDYLAEIYLQYRTIHYDDIVGPKGKNRILIRDVDANLLCDYASEDADITYRLKTILEEELKKSKSESLFYDIEMPLVRTLIEMELAGVRIDSEALKQSSIQMTETMNAIENEVQAVAGEGFNINSSKQVGELLFERLKVVEKAKKTKTGQYVTSEDILESLRSKHPIVSKILEYRGLKKLLSTYIDALPLLVKKQTGKIHTSYNQAVTSTGRLSSSNPNLQNIPVRDEQGREIRKVFIPDDGCIFFSADYSQIELRLMAHLSGDENMIEAFREGYDIHASTAAKIFKIDISEVSSDMRRKAKTANFGIIYGISVFGLSERLSIPRTEAKQLIDGYFETYPRVKAYMDESIEHARELGYVETIFGRKRFLPDIKSANSIVRGYAERNAINAPIQGSAADLIKIAMVRISNRFREESVRSQMILQVHDELNFNVYPDELDKVKSIVVDAMEHVAELSVPLRADCGIGNNWLEAH
ncbi:MAG: DNA polymerase I [Bacteroidia bacterium]|nr:DNA polymerase I [Bacteroidia bacterium]